MSGERVAIVSLMWVLSSAPDHHSCPPSPWFHGHEFGYQSSYLFRRRLYVISRVLYVLMPLVVCCSWCYMFLNPDPPTEFFLL